MNQQVTFDVTETGMEDDDHSVFVKLGTNFTIINMDIT
jgi:hypothetical protein